MQILLFLHQKYLTRDIGLSYINISELSDHVAKETWVNKCKQKTTM